MDRKSLISLLRRSGGQQTPRTPFCPDDNEIAAYIDATLIGSVRENIERHLPECRACIGRVGLLTRLMREQLSENQASIPDSRSRFWARAVPRWAVAASLFLAVGLLATITDLTTTKNAGTDYQTTRNLDSQILPPRILAPSSGVIGRQEHFLIRWTEVPGAIYYEVRIVSDVGDLVSTGRVEETEWTMSPNLNLDADREYFLRIDAFLTDAKSLSSDFIPFTIQE